MPEVSFIDFYRDLPISQVFVLSRRVKTNNLHEK